MTLDQNEIQELIELFPNSKVAIEHFDKVKSADDALDKLEQKINQLKEKLALLKVKKAKERNKFHEKVNQVIRCHSYYTDTYFSSYSEIDFFLAENSLNQLKTDDLINYEDKLISSGQETRNILLNAWLENYNDREIKVLESSILDLQTLVTQLTI